MKKIETNLKDCYIIEPDLFGDDRGYFSPYFKIEDFQELGFKDAVQLNRSKSSKGVVRGLHFQEDPYCQAKVVEVIEGEAIDVVVDLRRDSETYGKWTSVLLKPYSADDKESGRQLFVPRGFAHGFVSLKDNTIFQYVVDNKYAPKAEGGILWNDKEISIPWNEWFNKYGIDKPLLSEKDTVRDSLSKTLTLFRRNK